LFSSTVCTPCLEPDDQRTFAPAPTGRIIADLIAGRKPNIDIAPYRPDRF
jgi:hypothetical protein